MPVRCYYAPPAEDYDAEEDAGRYTSVIPRPLTSEPEGMVCLDSTQQLQIEQLADAPVVARPSLEVLPSIQEWQYRGRKLRRPSRPHLKTVAKPVLPQCEDDNDYIATGFKVANDLGKFANEVSWRGTRLVRDNIKQMIKSMKRINKALRRDAANSMQEPPDDQGTLF